MQKKTSLAVGLLLGTVLLSLSGCVSGSKEKKAEELEDPLKTKTEYYIVGKVTNQDGVVANADVKISDDIKTQTDAQGKYSLAVDKTGNYTLTFIASGLEELKASATITSTADNRSMMTLNIKMVKATEYTPPITVDTEQGSNIEVPNVSGNDKNPPAAVVEIPVAGTDKGVEVSVKAYEEPTTSPTPPSSNTETQATVQGAVSNIIIKTEPGNAKAKEDIMIATPNATPTTNDYFDPKNIVAMRDASTTKAWQDLGIVTYNGAKKQYEMTIPKGTQIAGKYSIRINAEKLTGKEVIGDFNTVNGKATTVEKDNSGNLSGIKDFKMTVEAQAGWEYTIDPATALNAQGASKDLVSFIKQQIEASEGTVGTYTITYTLKTNISGNSKMFYQNKAKYCTKTYTFKVIVNGVTKNVQVKLKCYIGSQEKYTNISANEHSGGGTGTL